MQGEVGFSLPQGQWVLWRKECLFVPDSILLRKMGSFVNVTAVGRESVLHFEKKNVSLICRASYFDDSAVFTWPVLLAAVVQL